MEGYSGGRRHAVLRDAGGWRIPANVTLRAKFQAQNDMPSMSRAGRATETETCLACAGFPCGMIKTWNKTRVGVIRRGNCADSHGNAHLLIAFCAINMGEGQKEAQWVKAFCQAWHPGFDPWDSRGRRRRPTPVR